MDAPPINLFSKTADPDGVRRLVVAAHHDAQVSETEDGGWTSIRVRRKRGFLRGEQTLQINHDQGRYSGAGWNEQLEGMRGYFSKIEVPEEQMGTLKAVIEQFAFTLAFVSDPPVTPGDDDFRYDLILDIARHLDACFFIPGYLLDSEGRVLVSADGDNDPDAVFPSVGGALASGQEHGHDGGPAEAGEPEPPEAGRVAARALVLAAVSARGLMELNASEDGSNTAELEASRSRAMGWCSELGITDEMEPGERSVLETPLGQLSERQHLDSIWRFEGLAVLAWALGIFELPRYDQVVAADAVLPVAGFLDAGRAREVLEGATLRPDDELRTFRYQMLAYHWRLRDFGLRPQAMDFRNFGETCWFGPLEMSWAEFDGDDLALDGTAIHRAGADLISTCSSIASERHLASNWLYDSSSPYSETDTST